VRNGTVNRKIALVDASMPKPTAGAGTLASPWSHTDGTGGINTAITLSAGGPVHIPAGHYAITSKITGFVSGQVVTTDGASTVMVVDAAIADGLWLEAIGTVSAYLENLEIGSMRVIRSGAGGLRLRYVRNCKVGTIWCDGAGGGVLSLRDIERCQFDGVIGTNLGALGAAIFTLRINRCNFGPVVATGGQEIIDLFETHHCTFAGVISIDAAEECVDMGCCSHNVFNNVVAINPGSNGITLKIEDGGTTGAYGFNQFNNVTITGHTVRGIDVANAPAAPNGTDTNNGNQFNNVVIESTVTGSVGMRVSGGTTNPVITGTVLNNFRIKTHGAGISSISSRRLRISNGYAESTNGIAIQLEAVSFATAITDPQVSNVFLVSGGATITGGAINLSRVLRPLLSGVKVLSSTGNGIWAIRCRNVSIDNCLVETAGFHGISIETPDDADWRGPVFSKVSNCVVRNVGTAGGSRYGLRFIQTGATPTVGLLVTNNQVHDTQTVITSRGVIITGDFNHSLYTGNLIKDVVATRVGSFAGTGSNMGTNIEAT
jgi:hypothetical protein